MRCFQKLMAASVVASLILLFDIYFKKGSPQSAQSEEPKSEPLVPQTEYWSPYQLPKIASAQILTYIKDTPPIYDIADQETKVDLIEKDSIHPAWAYFDPRFQRVTVLIMSHNAQGTVVYCHYVTPNGTVLHFRSKSLVEPEYFVHCEQKKFSHWIYVTEAEDIDSDDFFNQTRTGPIQVTLLPHEPAPANSLVMCVAPIFGDYHYWLLLLQFIEYHQIVGANYFFVYVHSTNDSATKAVLDFYERRKLIQVIHLPKSNSKEICVDKHRCRHNAQINDCVYRSINRFQYAAVIDIDELLQPAKHETLQQMIRSVDKPFYGAFMFRCRFIFRRQSEPKPSKFGSTKSADVHTLVSKHLPSLRWHKGAHPAPEGHTAKCIVKPDKVAFQGVHFVRDFVKKKKFKHKHYRVPLKLGENRHYRNTSIRSWNPKFKKEVLNFGPLTDTKLNVAQEQRLLLRVACVVSLIRGDQQPFNQYCVL